MARGPEAPGLPRVTPSVSPTLFQVSFPDALLLGGLREAVATATLRVTPFISAGRRESEPTHLTKKAASPPNPPVRGERAWETARRGPWLPRGGAQRAPPQDKPWPGPRTLPSCRLLSQPVARSANSSWESRFPLIVAAAGHENPCDSLPRVRALCKPGAGAFFRAPLLASPGTRIPTLGQGPRSPRPPRPPTASPAGRPQEPSRSACLPVSCSAERPSRSQIPDAVSARHRQALISSYCWHPGLGVTESVVWSPKRLGRAVFTSRRGCLPAHPSVGRIQLLVARGRPQSLAVWASPTRPLASSEQQSLLAGPPHSLMSHNLRNGTLAAVQPPGTSNESHLHPGGRDCMGLRSRKRASAAPGVCHQRSPHVHRESK